ncbi:hypothetical protein [Salinispora arenicola]|uniref:hypothetical protein n=1 Tax=Salinispora arenicola TaxID=168697 RepID=UPI00036F6F87|nr:hypothetical protein [Salinispora arenicola]
MSRSPLPAATAVDAASAAPDGPLFGQKLSCEQALAHPRINDFWQVMDFIVETEPLVHEHLYGHHPTLGVQPVHLQWERDDPAKRANPYCP